MNITRKDRMYMQAALSLADYSRCLRAHYAAVIVSDDDRIIAAGINGKPRGSKNDAVCYREGVPDAERTHECCIHAERNALMFCSPEARKGGTLYVTGIPCKTCALHIMQSGLRRIVYLVYSHSDSGKRISDDAFWDAYGIPIERVPFPEEEGRGY